MPKWEERLTYEIPARKELISPPRVEWVEEYTPNIQIDAGTALDYWKLGESKFGEENQEIVKIPTSGKGYNVSVDIRHKQDNAHSIYGVGFIFKTKKA